MSLFFVPFSVGMTFVILELASEPPYMFLASLWFFTAAAIVAVEGRR